MGDLNFDQALQGLKKAMAVMANMALRRQARLKEHEEWQRANELEAARHRDWLEEHEAAMRELDRNLDRIADLILKGRGGNRQHRAFGRANCSPTVRRLPLAPRN